MFPFSFQSWYCLHLLFLLPERIAVGEKKNCVTIVFELEDILSTCSEEDCQMRPFTKKFDEQALHFKMSEVNSTILACEATNIIGH